MFYLDIYDMYLLNSDLKSWDIYKGFLTNIFLF